MAPRPRPRLGSVRVLKAPDRDAGGEARVGGSRRRAENAEATRQAVIDAARTLFAAQGYFPTRVEQIAERARVAPKTVYGTVGGKQGLLALLAQEWVDAPVVTEGLARLPVLGDAGEVLALLSSCVRSQFDDHADVIRIFLTTAPHEPVAAEVLRLATERIRADLGRVARRLHDLAELPPHLGVDRATDVLWYYFGLTSYPLLVQENGWPPQEAEHWLREQALAALTDPARSPG